jgi:hypothetical protein
MAVHVGSWLDALMTPRPGERLPAPVASAFLLERDFSFGTIRRLFEQTVAAGRRALAATLREDRA